MFQFDIHARPFTNLFMFNIYAITKFFINLSKHIVEEDEKFSKSNIKAEIVGFDILDRSHVCVCVHVTHLMCMCVCYNVSV